LLDERGQVTMDFLVGCGLLIAVTISGFQVTAMVLSPDATAEYQAENYPVARMLTSALSTSPGEPSGWTADNVTWPGLCDAQLVLNLTKMSMLSELHSDLGSRGLADGLGLRDAHNEYFYCVRVESDGITLFFIGDVYGGEPGMGQARSPVAIFDPDTSEVALGNIVVQVWREWVGRDRSG